MKALKEILTKIKPMRLSQQEAALAKGLQNGQWKTDQEIMHDYWPDHPSSSMYLSSLKSRLASKLVPAILFYKTDSKYQSAYIECWREFAAVQVLKGIGLRKGAVWMAERLLKKAMQYDLTTIVVIISDMLELNAAHLSGDRNKWKHYQDINETYESIQQSEKIARRKLQEISSHFTTSRSIDRELAQLAEQYVEELQPDLLSIKSFHYGLYTYNLMVLQAELVKDSQLIIQVCQEALEYFERKPYTAPRSVTFLFNFKLVPAALQTRNFDLAHRGIERARAATDRQSYNHSVCLVYQAIIGFHSDQAELIYSAIQQSAKHRKYAPIAEQWRIIEAYAALFDIDTGKTFRLGKFLNEVPIFSKDKRGNNITILVLQILLYLKQGKKGKIIDRVEALKLYSHRYLRRDETYRSNCFIHMLLAMVKGNFHPVATQRYAKPYYEKLGAYRGGEVEVVPYERLWEVVLELLKG